MLLTHGFRAGVLVLGQGGRQKQCSSCVLKRKPVALDSSNPPPPKSSPSMAKTEQLLGVAEKTLDKMSVGLALRII